MIEMIEKIKKNGKNKKYDCVVGVSGGRDSTYLIYLLTRKHHLRCLCVYYRTPFTSDVIDLNIRRIVNELGADFEEIKLSKEFHKKIAKEMLLLWKSKQVLTIINFACSPCKLVNREIFRAATKHDIRCIVYGTNVYEAVQIAPSVNRKNSLIREGYKYHSLTNKLKDIARYVKYGTELLINYPQLIKYLPLGIQSSIMYISPHTGYLAFRYPRITAFDYFYFYRWDERELKSILKKVRWQLPTGCLSSWRADCSFAEVKNALFKKAIGISYLDAFLSNMIRAGILERDDALSRIMTEGYSDSRFKEALNILGLKNK
jgi:PP-loop superfamily ATP-utilizing enzyme